jgi:glycosyltransferase involved in cell wall biosynthesis
MTGPRHRIIRMIARLNIGGPARQVILLHDRLSSRGWDSLLVYGPVGDHEASLEALADARGVESRRIQELGRRIRAWSDLVALCKTIRLLYRTRPHVVHTHTAKAGAIGRIAAAVYNATRPRRSRCLVVHTFHGHVLDGYFGPVANQLVRMTERALALLTDRVIAISERQREDLVSRYRIMSADTVAVVPLGLELRSFLDLPSRASARMALGVPQDASVVAYVGRLVPIKRPLALIDAFANVIESCPNATLLVAGDGELRGTMELAIERYGLADRVLLLGWRSDLQTIYSAADIVALTSSNEGTPVALIEAMAAGIAVVATTVGGVPDLIHDGSNGVLVPPGDSGAMAAALARLIQNPEERGRLARTARTDVLARYDADRLAADLDNLYRTGLLDKRGRPLRELSE